MAADGNGRKEVSLRHPNISVFLRSSLDLEVVIVDDNSPDGTQAVVRELQKVYGARIVLHGRAGKLGLGSAYIDGLSKCSGDFIILMDADLSHHVSEQPQR